MSLKLIKIGVSLLEIEAPDFRGSDTPICIFLNSSMLSKLGFRL